MIEESLNNIIRKSLHIMERGIRSVVYNAGERVMLDLSHKDVIGDILGDHKAELFDFGEARDRLSKALLSLRSSKVLLEPITTFLGCKSDIPVKKSNKVPHLQWSRCIL